MGNSFTGWNDMPEMLKELSKNSTHNIYVDKYLWYGGSLYEISNEDTVRSIINSLNWDFVILQDSPYRFAYPEEFSVNNPLLTALANLKEMIRGNSLTTEIIIFMPWAYKDGQFWNETDPDDYKQMQLKVYQNAIPIAKSFDFKIAPVGWAWDKIVNAEEGIELFQQDLTHPTIEGSYLTACVIFSTIFREELINNLYISNIPKTTAEYLQSVASSTVLGELENWNLLTNISTQIFDNFVLEQNYPNPFNSQTTISFTLSEKSIVTLTIYNSIGEKVKLLLNREMINGTHSILFDADLLANGIYYYKIQANGLSITKKMVYLK
ncbi:MAG: T9SS type A sorting domain-containing protein [Melioribacteraceae bacterium]|nr:T9SS type A sorting domain-containing protein [Melioribacteraceae bacterium]